MSLGNRRPEIEVSGETRNFRLHYSGTINTVDGVNGEQMSYVLFMKTVKKEMHLWDCVEVKLTWLDHGEQKTIDNDVELIEMWNTCEVDHTGYLNIFLTRCIHPTRSSLRLKQRKEEEAKKLAEKNLELGSNSG